MSRAGRVALVGGFSLGLAGAASNATDLTFTYSGIYNGAPAAGESTEFDGLLDGVPEVLAVNRTLPPDTLAHLTAVLGGPLSGTIGAPDEPFFTSLRLP
jgi:hypothetical protein